MIDTFSRVTANFTWGKYSHTMQKFMPALHNHTFLSVMDEKYFV